MKVILNLHYSMVAFQGMKMDNLLSALVVGFAIFGLSTLTGVILYFLLKDYLKGVFRK